MLMFDRKQQNSVKQLSFNYKVNKLKKKRLLSRKLKDLDLTLNSNQLAVSFLNKDLCLSENQFLHNGDSITATTGYFYDFLFSICAAKVSTVFS